VNGPYKFLISPTLNKMDIQFSPNPTAFNSSDLSCFYWLYCMFLTSCNWRQSLRIALKINTWDDYNTCSPQGPIIHLLMFETELVLLFTCKCPQGGPKKIHKNILLWKIIGITKIQFGERTSKHIMIYNF